MHDDRQPSVVRQVDREAGWILGRARAVAAMLNPQLVVSICNIAAHELQPPCEKIWAMPKVLFTGNPGDGR